MKTPKMMLLGVLAAVALGANQNLRADISRDVSNRAVANSPRTREQFPWLERESSGQRVTVLHAESIPARVIENRALAASPRMREQYPGLAQIEQPVATPSKSQTEDAAFARVIGNSALANSPRAREEFPQLEQRQATESFEVAPIK